MLYEVSLNLAVRGYRVEAIARTSSTLEELARRAQALGGTVDPVPLDYSDTPALEAALQKCSDQHGPFEIAVAWVHPTAPQALRVLARHLLSSDESCRLVHVIGSAGADPLRRPSTSELSEMLRGSRVKLQEVVLGFVVEGKAAPPRSRWLTNEEISRGVLLAIDSGQARSVVGQVEPWSLRP